MQNGFYEVRLPDATDYWTEMVKCRHACPVHTDACGYVTAIAADSSANRRERIVRAGDAIRLLVVPFGDGRYVAASIGMHGAGMPALNHFGPVVGSVR